MIYRCRLETDSPPFNQVTEELKVFDDVLLRFAPKSDQADNQCVNFGLLEAYSPEDGSFLGGIILQHVIEPFPESTVARGFVIDEDANLADPPFRQRWVITQSEQISPVFTDSV